MTNPAVTVDGLTKIFPVPFHPTRGVVAVKDLSLRIEPGEDRFRVSMTLPAEYGENT